MYIAAPRLINGKGSRERGSVKREQKRGDTSSSVRTVLRTMGPRSAGHEFTFVRKEVQAQVRKDEESVPTPRG